VNSVVPRSPLPCDFIEPSTCRCSNWVSREILSASVNVTKSAIGNAVKSKLHLEVFVTQLEFVKGRAWHEAASPKLHPHRFLVKSGRKNTMQPLLDNGIIGNAVQKRCSEKADGHARHWRKTAAGVWHLKILEDRRECARDCDDNRQRVKRQRRS